MLEEFLVKIGLSDKESKIYLALLEVDESDVSSLAKKTKINRTTVYPVLDSLKEKGFVEEKEVKEKTVFRANSPEKIRTFVEEQKIKLYEQSKMVENMIPMFKSVTRGSGERPIVEYYEGREEVLRSVDDMFRNKKGGTMYVIYPRDEVEKNFSKKELDPIKKNRINKDIKINSIYTYTKGDYVSEKSPERMRIDSNVYPLKAEIGIYGESTRIHIFGKNAGTIYIKSIDVAETMKSLFKLAFDNKKK